jgi:hypothetical protein
MNHELRYGLTIKKRLIKGRTEWVSPHVLRQEEAPTPPPLNTHFVFHYEIFSRNSINIIYDAVNGRIS